MNQENEMLFTRLNFIQKYGWDRRLQYPYSSIDYLFTRNPLMNINSTRECSVNSIADLLTRSIVDNRYRYEQLSKHCDVLDFLTLIRIGVINQYRAELVRKCLDEYRFLKR